MNAVADRRFGWLDRPADVAKVVGRLPMPLFAVAAPHLKGSAAGRDVVYWEAEEKILGRTLSAHVQTRGTCVSHGWGRGVQDLMLGQILLGNRREEFPAEVATEPIYAGSRVEIGRGQVRGDGSVGAWAAEWVQKFGILLRRKYGNVDLTTPDDELAAEWGAPRAGVPDELEPIAREHPVKTVSLVETPEAGADALANWYPIPVCSNQGFTTTRDANGFCKPRGTWAHCMVARGFVTVKGNRPAVPIQQSWGESPTGPNRVTLESGREITLPQGVFLIDLDVFGRMLKAGDSFAVSDFEGFPAKRLEYLLI
jgi:hypothetical protein